MSFPDKGKQLYLGEGDFSLARSLCEANHLPKETVVTCFAKELTEEAASNSKYLQSKGITVITGVDATKLDTYEALSKNRYDYIIFNFPHTGHKMKIHLCRALLRKFLSSAAPLLVTSGQVWVTLCAGQGGTAGDSVRRAWADSWQLTAQAAAAGLVLRRLQTFDPGLVPGYRPTGNRGRQSRTFHTRNGVIHVLAAGRPPCLDAIRFRLPGDGARLLLGDAPLPLCQYWLGRLPPGGDSLAALVVRRLSPGAPPRRRVLVPRGDGLYSAGQAELDRLAAGGDLICRLTDTAEDDLPGLCPGDGRDVCVTYTVQDGEVAPGVSSAPLRTRLRISSPADAAPDPRHALAQFGLACKETRQEGTLELRVSCGGNSLTVAEVRTINSSGSAETVVTTFDIDAVTACWVGHDDWRHSVRTDFHTGGAVLTLHSIYPPIHTLDMSFWLSGGDLSVSEPFSWSRLRRTLRAALGELLVKLDLLDEYQQPETGRRACTVRIQYQDLSGPLAYQTARRLHEEVLPGVLSRTLGVATR